MDPRICCYVAILVCLHCIAADDELGRPLMGLTGSDLKRIGRHVRATADELGHPPPSGLDAKGISRQKRAAADEFGYLPQGPSGLKGKRIHRQVRGAAEEFGGLPPGRLVRAAADKLGTPPIPPPQGLTGSSEKRIGRRVRATADELQKPPPSGLDAKGISRQKRGAAEEFGGLPLGRLVRAAEHQKPPKGLTGSDETRIGRDVHAK